MELRGKVMRALSWSLGAKFGGQLLTWVVTIIVIRLLNPRDYGLIAMALVVRDAIMMFSELGLGAALIQRRQIDARVLRQVFTLVLLIGIVLALIMFVSSWGAAAFFAEPAVVPIMQLLALQFLIGAFEAVPTALLERELDMKRKSLVFLAAQIIGSLVTLLLAWNGFGVWSLVWGSLAATTARSIGINLVRPVSYEPTADLRGTGGILSFGGTVSMERIVWFLSNNLDIAIVGRVLGVQALGIYAVAMHLSSLIMTKTGEIMYTVSFPAFSQVQDDRALVAQYLLKAVRVMAFVVFPLFWGMSVIAHELVAVLLGEKWLAAGTVLQIVCLVMPLRMIGNLLPPVLQAIGEPARSVRNLLYTLAIMPIAFWIGTRWGLFGVSLAWVIAYPLALLLMLRRSLPLLGLGTGAFLRAMAGAAASAAAMYAVVWATAGALPAAWPDAARLPLLVLTGMLAYPLAAWVLNRPVALECLDLLRRRH